MRVLTLRETPSPPEAYVQRARARHGRGQDQGIRILHLQQRGVQLLHYRKNPRTQQGDVEKGKRSFFQKTSVQRNQKESSGVDVHTHRCISK